MARVSLLLAILASAIHATRLATPVPQNFPLYCEWLGAGPFCGNWDCGSGWTEIMRHKDGRAGIADFGEYNCWTGAKTLCCKSKNIAGDPKEKCDKKLADILPQCAIGRYEILQEYTICDKYTIKHGPCDNGPPALCCDGDLFAW